MNKCSHGDGVTVQVNGVPVDACVFEDVKKYRNVTVIVIKCKYCERVSHAWILQDNTE